MYLKSKKALIESINETIEIRELNALGYRELMDAHSKGDLILAAAITVKYGTKKWLDKTAEEIMAELPLSALQEISDQVTELTGVGEETEKN